MSRDKERRSEEGYKNQLLRSRCNNKAKYEEYRSEGKCYKCGNPCLINLNTGKPFAACVLCRESERKRQVKIRNSPSRLE